MATRFEGASVSKRGRSYLIVDDAPRVREVLQAYLQDLDISEKQIDVASNGDEALEVFRERQPDVVFMDISMPGMDGEEVTQTMLTEEPTTKVIVVTGKSREDEKATRLVSLGAFDFINKPFHREDIRTVLKNIQTEDSGADRIQ